MKPKTLDFYCKDGKLYGSDGENEYRISWCGNGSYSHYVLNAVNPDVQSWYVYTPHWNYKEKLYDDIRLAEMELIFHVNST